MKYVKIFCIHVCKLVTIITEADNNSGYGLVVGVGIAGLVIGIAICGAVYVIMTRHRTKSQNR